MKLCQRCRLEFAAQCEGCSFLGDEKPVPESDCEFWAHKVLRAFQSRQIRRITPWEPNGEKVAFNIRRERNSTFGNIKNLPKHLEAK